MTATGTTGTTGTTGQAAQAPFDPAKAAAFGGRIMQILGGGLLSLMVDIGHRTGLFAAASEGWATSDQLAAGRPRWNSSPASAPGNVALPRQPRCFSRWISSWPCG